MKKKINMSSNNNNNPINQTKKMSVGANVQEKYLTKSTNPVMPSQRVNNSVQKVNPHVSRTNVLQR